MARRGWIWMTLALGACATGASQTEAQRSVEPVTPATRVSAPQPGSMARSDAALIEHGRYLVELLGCGSCHTDGALIGVPRMDRRLAGSHIGIAYSNPLETDKPGVVYGANLTPDVETGIGGWTTEEIVQVVRTGLDRHGRQQLPIMPWPVYSRLSDTDGAAIAAYLQSLDPVVNAVPDPVAPGEPAREPYVHFGVYTYEHD